MSLNVFVDKLLSFSECVKDGEGLSQFQVL